MEKKIKPMVVIIGVVVLSSSCVCRPPKVNESPPSIENTDNSNVYDMKDALEYERYLKEVVNALESDPDFRKQLEQADEKDIRSGKIAENLELVSHHVRNRLDEAKRVELERLRQLKEREKQLMGNTVDVTNPHHAHLDKNNPHSFEIDDLKKLIAKTTEDLAEADKKRRMEFKEYEMRKELAKREKLVQAKDEKERETLRAMYDAREQEHRKHERLHQPGHRAQLEEVWEKQDQMANQNFDPRTFFLLHDVDGNGLWDQSEVNALFVKELEKMYQAGHPEDDMREKIEEMERMRESMFSEIDSNRDGFIDFKEFLEQTKSKDFQVDNGWEGLDQQRVYTQEELDAFMREQQLAHQRQMQQQQQIYQQQQQIYQQNSGGNSPYKQNINYNAHQANYYDPSVQQPIQYQHVSQHNAGSQQYHPNPQVQYNQLHQPKLHQGQHNGSPQIPRQHHPAQQNPVPPAPQHYIQQQDTLPQAHQEEKSLPKDFQHVNSLNAAEMPQLPQDNLKQHNNDINKQPLSPQINSKSPSSLPNN